MDPAAVVTILKVLGGLAGALAILWGYVLWDGRQARAQFRSDEFEARVAALFTVAIRTDEFQAVVTKAVNGAFTTQLEHVLREISGLRSELGRLRTDLDVVSTRVEGLMLRGRQRQADEVVP